ncbi:MAG: hypothetical protein IJW40_12095, partial [Clostridia bacterium]|nr:hypothetical protein [Clostridia bacterium]
SDLYDEICTLLDRLSKCEVCTGEIIRRLASEQLSAYQAPVDGARERLLNALEIIVVSYYASLVKKSADAMLRELTGEVADAASDDEE